MNAIANIVMHKSLCVAICFRYRNKIISNLNNLRYFAYDSDLPNVKRLREKDLTPVDSTDDDEITKVGNINHRLRLLRYNRRHDVPFYERLIEEAALKGDKEKMLEVFFHDMLITDRVKPTIMTVNFLLQKLASLGGHSEAAFKILRKTIDISLKPTPSTYGLVFKNCAKEISNNNFQYRLPTKTVSLLSAGELDKVRNPVRKCLELWENYEKHERYGENGKPLPVIGAVNSLLLTLARAGMISESFALLDKFLEEGNRPDSYTLSAALEACLTDRQNGLGLGLVVFHTLLYKHKCNVTCVEISNLLKLVRNCQLGSASLIDRLISMSTNVQRQSFSDILSLSPPGPETLLQLPGADSTQSIDCAIEPVPLEPNPNSVIHCCDPQFNQIINRAAEKYNLNLSNFVNSHWSNSNSVVMCVKSPTNFLFQNFRNVFKPSWLESRLEPSDKLACLGGLLGIFQFLNSRGVPPNSFVLTDLMTCLPYKPIFDQNYPSDDIFVAIIKSVGGHFKVKTDQAFINAINKRNYSHPLQDNSAGPINLSKFDPYSWSAYTKKCKTAEDVRNFIHIMKESQVVPNKEIYQALMKSVSTWGARCCVLRKMVAVNIELDRSTIVHIEDEINKMRMKIKSMSAEEKEQTSFRFFYFFQKVYSNYLNQSQTDPVTTGDRKIFIDDLPKFFQKRKSD